MFPEYRGVLGDLYSVVSLLTLVEFPSSEDILNAREETLTDKINKLCRSRSIRWANENANELIAAAKRNPFEKTVYQSHILSLDMFINILLQYKEHLSTLESEIDAFAKEVEEYTIIKSIPGIGEKIAATIISEIGEIDRFDHPKKLVAFAGVDPSVFESGKFTATKNRITKRGSSRLPHALYMAVRCAIRDCRKEENE